MLISVIVKVFVKCCFLQDPWRWLILTQTKNSDHIFSPVHLFLAHDFFTKKITSKFYYSSTILAGLKFSLWQAFAASFCGAKILIILDLNMSFQQSCILGSSITKVQSI